MESFLSQADNQAYHPAGELKSQGNEPHLLVFVFFAFFAVNLDYSFQVELTHRRPSSNVQRGREPQSE
jgi:hypothetical protein